MLSFVRSHGLEGVVANERTAYTSQDPTHPTGLLLVKLRRDVEVVELNVIPFSPQCEHPMHVG
jgi:hypothetical protein